MYIHTYSYFFLYKTITKSTISLTFLDFFYWKSFISKFKTRKFVIFSFSLHHNYVFMYIHIYFLFFWSSVHYYLAFLLVFRLFILYFKQKPSITLHIYINTYIIHYLQRYIYTYLCIYIQNQNKNNCIIDMLFIIFKILCFIWF